MSNFILMKRPNRQTLRQHFWHGTKGQNLKNILKEGIKPGRKPKLGATQHFKQYHYDAIGIVCLTNNEGNACFYATASYPLEKVKSAEFEPVALQIHPSYLNRTLMVPRLPSGNNLYKLYRGSREFDYTGIIPSEAIVGYLKWDKKKKKYQYFMRCRGKNNRFVIGSPS